MVVIPAFSLLKTKTNIHLLMSIERKAESEDREKANTENIFLRFSRQGV